MKPGPDMDYEVAKRVMLWTPHEAIELTDDGPIEDDFHWIDREGKRHEFTPEYSTNRDLAMGIAEGFMKAGCAYEIGGDGHTGWDALVTSMWGRFEAHSDESAAHAICLAALKNAEEREKKKPENP